MEVKSRIVSIYTEATPNPETMKFVLNKMLYAQNSADFTNAHVAEGASPLASELFQKFNYVDGVFIMNNFVTVTKKTDHEWFEIIPELREHIRQYVIDGKEIINADLLAEKIVEHLGSDPNVISEDDSEIVKKIKQMITQYVQPAVEMDGGSIVFRGYTDGIVRLGMQGSCSGCPSSTITLKSGIEGLLKRMVPGVQGVEAEMM